VTGIPSAREFFRKLLRFGLRATTSADKFCSFDICDSARMHFSNRANPDDANTE